MRQEVDDKVGAAAAFVAARLQYPNPRCNGSGNPWVSTILVHQHKEKFGTARVYCELACPAMVSEKWAWLRANSELRLPRRHMMQVDASSEHPTPDFFRVCALRDAMHYRDCYRDMASLWPRLASRLLGGADHGELLYDTVDAAMEAIVHVSGPDRVPGLRKKHHLRETDELRDFLNVVYNPTLMDRLECSG